MNIKKSTSSADTDAYSSSSTPPPIASLKPSLWKLFHLAMPEMPMLLLSFILMIGSEATNMITPLIVANAYDVLVDPTITNEGEKMSEINGYMLIAIIITIVGIIAGSVLLSREL